MVALTLPHHHQYGRPALSSIASSHSPLDYVPSPRLTHRDSDTSDTGRYSTYSSRGSPPERKSSISSKALSVDIPSMAQRTPSVPHHQDISLPPIQRLNVADLESSSPYALPPISALEDLRGVETQDSAAVLRRLRLDDDYPSSSRSTHGQDSWNRRHSLAVQPVQQ